MDLDKKKVWYRTCPNKPNEACDQIARIIVRKFEQASHQIFHGPEPFLKGDLQPKKGKQTMHVLSTTEAKTIRIRTNLAFNQFCMQAAVCV